jgi:hypothetical protein
VESPEILSFAFAAVPDQHPFTFSDINAATAEIPGNRYMRFIMHVFIEIKGW